MPLVVNIISRQTKKSSYESNQQRKKAKLLALSEIYISLDNPINLNFKSKRLNGAQKNTITFDFGLYYNHDKITVKSLGQPDLALLFPHSVISLPLPIAPSGFCFRQPNCQLALALVPDCQLSRSEADLNTKYE